MFSIFTGCMMTLITSLVIVMQLCVVNQCMCVGGVMCGGVSVHVCGWCNMCVSACVWVLSLHLDSDMQKHFYGNVCQLKYHMSRMQL